MTGGAKGKIRVRWQIYDQGGGRILKLNGNRRNGKGFRLIQISKGFMTGRDRKMI